MKKPDDPRELAIALLSRSPCTIQMAAVIADGHGIFSWGWNSPGSGFGEHAEAAAIRRANKKRLALSTIYVAGRRVRNGKMVPSLPCPDCMKKLASRGILGIYFMDNKGHWLFRYVE